MADHNTRSQQLHDALRHIIAQTEPGERLLTEPELARQLGVSRATLREAMRTFETQGLIRRRQGAGTFVIHPAYIIDTGLEVLESIETVARRIGLKVEMGELRFKTRPAHLDEQEALNLPEDAQVFDVTRVIMAEGRAVAFLIDILPTGTLTEADFGENFSGSVLDLLVRKGQPSLSHSRTEINAVTATPEVARAFGIQRGDVLLMFKANLYTDQGQVIDYSTSYFLPGYFHFHVIRKVGLPAE